jgi:hypothetical protein
MVYQESTAGNAKQQSTEQRTMWLHDIQSCCKQKQCVHYSVLLKLKFKAWMNQIGSGQTTVA